MAALDPLHTDAREQDPKGHKQSLVAKEKMLRAGNQTHSNPGLSRRERLSTTYEAQVQGLPKASVRTNNWPIAAHAESPDLANSSKKPLLEGGKDRLHGHMCRDAMSRGGGHIDNYLLVATVPDLS